MNRWISRFMLMTVLILGNQLPTTTADEANRGSMDSPFMGDLADTTATLCTELGSSVLIDYSAYRSQLIKCHLCLRSSSHSCLLREKYSETALSKRAHLTNKKPCKWCAVCRSRRSSSEIRPMYFFSRKRLTDCFILKTQSFYLGTLGRTHSDEVHTASVSAPLAIASSSASASFPTIHLNSSHHAHSGNPSSSSWC